MTPYNELIHGKLYYIYQPSTDLTHDFYKGRFVKYTNMFVETRTRLSDVRRLCHNYLLTFEDVSALKPVEYLGEGNFGKTELYYDVVKIKENATKARQTMEKRALDRVLSMILNEDFTWY